jgi:hypothetical protein
MSGLLHQLHNRIVELHHTISQVQRITRTLADLGQNDCWQSVCNKPPSTSRCVMSGCTRIHPSWLRSPALWVIQHTVSLRNSHCRTTLSKLVTGYWQLGTHAHSVNLCAPPPTTHIDAAFCCSSDNTDTAKAPKQRTILCADVIVQRNRSSTAALLQRHKGCSPCG